MTTDTPSPTQATLPAELIEEVARAIHDALYADDDSGAWMSGKCPLDSVTIDGDVDLLKATIAALFTPSLTAMREAAALAEAWLRECSTWLLTTDLDMTCPMQTDPLDIADDIRAALSHKKEDGQ